MMKESKHQDIICGHGIASIPGVRIHVFLYLVDGLLIDTGPASLLRQTKRFLSQKTIEQVALTHIHEDHAGCAPWIKETYGVPVYLHARSIDEAAKRTNLPFYRKIIWANRKAFQADAIPPVIETGRFSFDVINSPGHHPHHIVLHEKKMGWLFSGDCFVKQRQHVSYLDENTADAITTLRTLLELDFDTLFCGHAGVQINGKTTLQMKLDHFVSIREKVMHLYRQGRGIKEITASLYPRKDLWTVLSRNEWSSYNMIRTIIDQDASNDHSHTTAVC